MRYRKEILRGVRLAAVVFAVLLLALISYRVLHGAPSEASRKTVDPVVRPEAAPKPPIVHVSAPDVDVPPPPSPSSGSSRPARVHKAPAPVQQTAAALSQPVILNGDPEPAPQPVASAPVNQVAAPPVVVPVQTAPEVVSATPEAPQDAPPNPANHKRGVLRSVGHFLHIGRRDTVQPDALNQP